MSKDYFSDWDTNENNNTDLGGTSTQGTQTVKTFDNLFRRLMAQLATAVMTVANFWGNATGKIVTTDQVWSAAAAVALTDAATIAVDMSSGGNFTVTLGGNRTLGQPSNTKVGQAGFIKITQDGTGSRTLSFHADWKFANGTDPTLSTTAGAIDVLFYQVTGSNQIVASLVRNIS